LLINVQGLAQLPDEVAFIFGEEAPKKELFASKVDVNNTRELLDCFVLLANADNFLKAMGTNGMVELLKVLKVPAFGESKEKIDILAGQLATLDVPVKAVPKSFDLD
jgi:hypothetical protein